MEIRISKKNMYLQNYLAFKGDMGGNSSEYVPDNVYSALFSNVVLRRNGIYYNVTNAVNEMPDQGWKIHISAIKSNAIEILGVCKKICAECQVNFKFMCDSTILTASVSKNWLRGQSGKFITIYPNSEGQAKELLKALYESLKGFDGPYILSDKRYKPDCKVLFYRYGGFKDIRMQTNNGQKVLAIVDKHGIKQPDIRDVKYRQPIWIESLFGKKIIVSNESRQHKIVLNKRFRIEHVVRHTNSGGIYYAYDIFTNSNVIIKEARPFTSTNLLNEDDATVIREREFTILNMLLKKHVYSVPIPIKFFKEWENEFLVESVIAGEDLQMFVANQNPLGLANFYQQAFLKDNNDKLRKYLKLITNIAIKLIKAIDEIHNANIYLGDMSIFNVMINGDQEVYFPDLEGAGFLDEPSPVDNFTPGFSTPHKLDTNSRIVNDFVGVGLIVINLLLPVNYEYELDESIIDRLAKMMNSDFGIPQSFFGIMKKLIQGESVNSITQVIKELTSISFENVKINLDVLAVDSEKIKNEIVKMDKSILRDNEKNLASCKYDSTLVTANELNVYHGLAGYVHYAHNNHLEHKKSLNELQKKWPLIDGLGLFTGLSGVAWTLLECGCETQAIKAIDSVYQEMKVIDIQDFSLASGLSGIGLTSLYFYQQTGDNKYLNEARKLAHKILLNAHQSLNTLYWQTSEEKVMCGLEKGASGVSIFLLKLSTVDSDENMLEFAKKALQFDIDCARKDKEGMGLRRSPKSNIVSPYILSGTGGLILVLNRFYEITSSVKYSRLSIELTDDIVRKYMSTTGYGEGLSGLGIVLLNQYELYKDEKFLNAAKRVYWGLHLYAITKNDEISYPGMMLLRLSFDFRDGTIGVTQFYRSLVDAEKKEFKAQHYDFL